MNFDKGQIYQWGQLEEWVCDLSEQTVTVWWSSSTHGEPGRGRHLQQQSCHRGRKCPAQRAPQLDLGNHEKVKWPPLLALKRVARRTLAILGQVKRSWKRSWKAQQGGARDFGGEGSLGGGREENIAPEGLFGFLLRRSIVCLVVTLTFHLCVSLEFWCMTHKK